MKSRILLFLLCILSMPNAYGVYGGRDVLDNELPWVAALVNDDVLSDSTPYLADGAYESYQQCLAGGQPHSYCGQFCSASLIASEWAITAAHCVARNAGGLTQDFSGKEDKLRFLFNNPDISVVTGIERRGVPGSLLVPSNFTIINQRAWDYDVALVRLDSPIDESLITPASLAERSVIAGLRTDGVDVDDLFRVVGHGESEAGFFPLFQQTVALDYDSDCGDWGSTEQNRITVRMICAGEANPEISERDDRLDPTPLDPEGEGTCLLDSGGPLFFSDIDSYPRIAGITSWGDALNCGVASRPGVFTDLAAMVDWIQDSGAGGGAFFDLALYPSTDPLSAEIGSTLIFDLTLANNTDGQDAYIVSQPRLDIRYDVSRIQVVPSISCSDEAWGKRCDFSGVLLARGDRSSLSLTVSAVSGGELSETIHLKAGPSSNPQLKWDYRGANNNIAIPVAFTDKPDPRVSQLYVENTAAFNDDLGGATLGIVLENASYHVDASGAFATIDLPSGLSFVNSPQGCSGASGQLTCDYGSLVPSEESERQFYIEGPPGLYTVTVLASADNGDVSPGSASQISFVLPGPQRASTPNAAFLASDSGGVLGAFMSLCMAMAFSRRTAARRGALRLPRRRPLSR